jgi:hypothetical protein
MKAETYCWGSSCTDVPSRPAVQLPDELEVSEQAGEARGKIASLPSVARNDDEVSWFVISLTKLLIS